MRKFTVGERVVREEKISYAVVEEVYPLQEETGRGLYKVKSSRDGLFYALKVFDLSKNAMSDVQKEMVALNNQNQHPHWIPRFRDCFKAEGAACVVIDWMDGTRFDRVTNGTSATSAHDVKFRVRMLMSLCDSVHVLHAGRYWHRDLKPQNVLLRDPKDPGKGAILVDFGLVAARRAAGEEGTTGYNAPEQFGFRNHSLGAHTDVYSLGQIGWYLLTGAPLYREVNDEGTDWSQHYTPLGEATGAAQAPAGLETVLLQAMSFDVRKRQRSVRELKNELVKYSR
ncbi:serine/threonine protein kinase [Geomonas subterranea]|uniref:serine/threonine protein kinase n=1 Tax=Geomonas subterranea TaxID=2847989 RepID=UPI001CD19E13|nr:protein kinase [Geomonas fuzhouensis]